MEPNTRVIGKKTVLGGMANLHIKMVTTTKEIGYTMKQMERESIKERMDQPMKENGEETYSMAKVNRFGRMEAIMRANLKMVLSKASENTFGLMEICIKDNGKIISFMVVGLKNCMMVDYIKGIGSKGACMEGEFTHGPTDRNTRENIT